MFRIQGPYPAYKTTLLLPSPEMGNTRNLASTVQTLRTMDGTLYTYIKQKRNRKVHKWEFIASRDKSQEAKAFADAYMGNVIRIIDHEEVTHLGYVTLNPLELQGEGRAGGYPGVPEAYRFSLQLEELV
jgi:hypothetical protein